MDLDELTALPQLVEALGDMAESDRDLTTVTGSLTTWRGPFAIDDLATSCVVAATAAAATLLGVRNRTSRAEIVVDANHSAASFLADGYIEPRGWTVPPVWDPIAGDYRTADGWVRLHTNYPHHRSAALRALGIADSPTLGRDHVADVVRSWSADELESAVVAAHGVAGAQRSATDWRRHAASAARKEPLLARTHTTRTPHRIRATEQASLPFDGIRVLDLTRVLAGPTATGFLAAWGADVLRIDPPGFPEVGAVLPTTTCAKRCASLDLATTSGRDHFLALLRDADVIVHGLRADALERLGLGPEVWHDHRPGLVEVALDAYGWSGPWTTRRGFDSIVQHSVGITTEGQATVGADHPVPLPCQALDYAAGWLMAAATAAALIERERTGEGSVSRTSLAGVANLLQSMPRSGELERPAPTLTTLDPLLATADTAWGPMRRLRWPGTIGDLAPRLGRSGPVGVAPATW